MKSIFLATALSVIVLAATHSQVPVMSKAPKPIQELAAEIQGKPTAEIQKAIVARFGAGRNVGSGLRILRWDVEGGELTLHPRSGPTFTDLKSKKIFRLLPTKNLAAANLLGSYEMTTVPDPANHGNCTWLGNLQFGPDSTYTYTECGQPGNLREAEPGIFFFAHPSGKVEVRYHAPVTPETPLESLSEDSTVATLVFTSSTDKAQTATFTIKSSEQSRTLRFSGTQRLPFKMEKGWQTWK